MLSENPKVEESDRKIRRSGSAVVEDTEIKNTVGDRDYNQKTALLKHNNWPPDESGCCKIVADKYLFLIIVYV